MTNSNDSIHYYVYFHIDPETDEIVYIGSGTGERAWCVRPGKKLKGGGHRKPEHSFWCYQLMDAGLTPEDWVYIKQRGMTRIEARQYEEQLIKKHKPLFNYKRGVNFILSDEQVIECFDLRDLGYSYSAIAQKINTSTMTVWRRLNDTNV